MQTIKVSNFEEKKGIILNIADAQIACFFISCPLSNDLDPMKVMIVSKVLWQRASKLKKKIIAVFIANSALECCILSHPKSLYPELFEALH